MAAHACLSIRTQVQAERARGTGDRQRNEYRSLSIVPSKQVRRALSTAEHLMQAILAIGPRCAMIIRRHTWTPACFGGMSCGAYAVPPGPQMTFNSACRPSFFTTDIARSSAPGSDPG